MENEISKIKEIHAQMASLCSRSEQCSPDIRKKILASGLDNDSADEIIKELKKENFIDDKRYIASYIDEKIRINKWGKIKIRYYLKMKGIGSDLIENGLDEIDKDSYRDMLVRILKEKARTVRKKNRYEKMGQVIRFAQSRGFEPELIHRYLNDIVE
jgi:regulatory protein